MNKRATTLFAFMAIASLIAACGEPTSPGTSGNDQADEQSGGPVDIKSLSGSVNLNTSGGVVDEIWQESWWAPFTDETGVDVRTSSPADLSRLRAQVESGNVEWDVTEIETGGQYLEAVEQELLTEFDQERFREYFEQLGGDWDDMMPEAVATHGIRHAPFATILMFDEREFPEGEPQPTSVTDLWNVEDFPGPRCIHEQALYNLEIALAADGVGADEMYPLDVERAIGKLDELAPHIATFWNAGAESIQLVADGECVMSTVWNGRPFGAQSEDDIDYLGVAWDSGIMASSYWVIPRGAPNPESAYALLATYQLPEVGASTANQVGYGNTNTATDDLINEDARPFVATYGPNMDVVTVQDEQWWYENGESAEERFSKWRLAQ
ncbi:extracellular solute-binding protein [Haloechinothrix sp. YIM 98757]|uniref:Extracellular solute-binding protein n=1 Tax=Haloechinothrix aidingensis TaxID=2752311 RepID=A0A838A7U9_9PSEU|nr:extracellular solute-binding protein [Haloechinothrix aidingensis]MBA0124262.1 extracellular solute-binding protein [Haloechinothrix aidingensis]